jgi:type I restriction enzyme M protein
LVEAGLIDCIVNLPAKLFLNTQIPASLWFLSRNRSNGKYRNRTGEILFIDARNMGHLINRRTRELSEDDIQTIASTYHNWRCKEGEHKMGEQGEHEVRPYEDVNGFCNAASIERVKELDYVLTPGRYVGLAEEKDAFDFGERFTSLKAEFEQQLKEEAVLNQRIIENLAKVKIRG